MTERKNQAISYIQDLERQFSDMKLSEMVSQLNTFARSAKNAFQKIIQEADDMLHTSKVSFESLTKKYLKFKQNNQLEYEPHYPPSRVLLFSILFIEVLAETILNFNFFKDVSEDYIIGGVYNAFLLSLINVGILGWLFGKNCFWFKNHINKTKATLGWASLGLFLFLYVCQMFLYLDILPCHNTDHITAMSHCPSSLLTNTVSPACLILFSKASNTGLEFSGPWSVKQLIFICFSSQIRYLFINFKKFPT